MDLEDLWDSLVSLVLFRFLTCVCAESLEGLPLTPPPPPPVMERSSPVFLYFYLIVFMPDLSPCSTSFQRVFVSSFSLF